MQKKHETIRIEWLSVGVCLVEKKQKQKQKNKKKRSKNSKHTHR